MWARHNPSRPRNLEDGSKDPFQALRFRWAHLIGMRLVLGRNLPQGLARTAIALQPAP